MDLMLTLTQLKTECSGKAREYNGINGGECSFTRKLDFGKKRYFESPQSNRRKVELDTKNLEKSAAQLGLKKAVCPFR